MEESSKTSAQTIHKPLRRKFSTVLAIVLVFCIGLFVGRYLVPAGGLVGLPFSFIQLENGERQLVFPTFWEAWDVLHEHFIGELKEQDLFYGAIAGMVRAADDPYTVFTTPEDTQQFEETIGGSFSGVGIEIGVRGGLVVVIAPLEGSPADAAGIKEGDIIVAVDKEAITQDMTLDEVVQKIRGERGKPVTLTVVHKGANAPEDITVVRDTINIQSVRLEIKDTHAYIRITNFNGDTAGAFTAAAREIQKAGSQGIILDMRGNPGGFLQAAVDIASRFVEPGSVVVSERGKKSKEYKADGSALLKDIPVVVLVNEGSASASEIVAGALRDVRNTLIIGTKTFGKGSVQEFIKLKDGSSLRVTVAKWFTPAGHSIDEQGIEPTILVEDNRDTEEDEQMKKAEEELVKIAR